MRRRKTIGYVAAGFLWMVSLCPAHAQVTVAVVYTAFDEPMAAWKQYFPDAKSARVGSPDPMDVARLMLPIQRMPYKFSPVWQSAEQVLSEGQADCKGKSMLLLKAMREAGADSVSVVIGRMRPTSVHQHVWLTWRHGGTEYILDPMEESRPLRADRVRRGHYRAEYIFDGRRSMAVIPAAWFM